MRWASSSPFRPTAKEETAGVEWYDSGIGFAIPMDDVLASAASGSREARTCIPACLGVTMKEGGIDERPTIDHVRFDSPAERAGLKAGDVFAEIDGHPVGRHDEVKQVLGRKYAGDKVAIVVRRGEVEHPCRGNIDRRAAPLRAGVPRDSSGA